MRLLIVLTCIAVSVAACMSSTEQRGLKPFVSDGCSLFPDQSFISRTRWCGCCLQHDVAYWRGGSEAQREEADKALRECITEKTEDEILANVMYEAVRVGGSPYFPNWYRWGYGWPFERMYEPLTEAELDQVEQRWRKFENSGGSQECEDAPKPSELKSIIDSSDETR